jgi:hypothetical protein
MSDTTRLFSKIVTGADRGIEHLALVKMEVRRTTASGGKLRAK